MKKPRPSSSRHIETKVHAVDSSRNKESPKSINGSGKQNPVGRRPLGEKIDAKEQILQAAILVISEKGILRSTVKEIAKRADLTPAMVHYYFQCRETLIQTTLDRFLIPISDSVWEAVDLPIGPLEMLREFHLRLREVFTKVPWYASLWSKELASSEGNLQGYMRSLINPERLRRFKEKIEQGQKQGLINPVLAPELVFPSLIALIYLPRLGLHSWEQLWNTNISEEVVTRHVWATIIDGLAAKDAGKLK